MNRISFRLISIVISLFLVLGSLSFVSSSKVQADCGTHSGLFNVFASYGHYNEDEDEDEDHECPEPSPSPSPSVSPSPTPSGIPSPTPSVSPTPTPSASPSVSPTPSPSPSASPSPTPEPCEDEYEEECEDCEDECEDESCEDECNGDCEDECEDCEEECVEGVKTPTVQPETGVGVLGLATMASAAPLGILLAKFGRGFKVTSRKEENLASFASDLVNSRVQK